MDFQSTDIFTFDPNWVYAITLVGGIIITGAIVHAYDNGIVTNNGTHIPTDKILYFIPERNFKTDETN